MRVIKNIGKCVGALLLMVIIWFVAMISFGTYQERYECEGTYFLEKESQGRASAKEENRTGSITMTIARFFNPLFHDRNPSIHIELVGWRSFTFSSNDEYHISFSSNTKESRSMGILSKVTGRLWMSSPFDETGKNDSYFKETYEAVCKKL